jgi:peptide/nickel transport system substrate-binding protein
VSNPVANVSVGGRGTKGGAYEQVIYIPLGQYLAPSAWSTKLSGVIGGPATPVFWNIEKK